MNKTHRNSGQDSAPTNANNLQSMKALSSPKGIFDLQKNQRISKSPSNAAIKNQSYLNNLNSASVTRGGTSQQLLFPTLEMQTSERDVNLPEGANFNRQNIKRSSLSTLLKAASGNGEELAHTKTRKQLKYMANMYRKQIFKINENMNMGSAPQVI